MEEQAHASVLPRKKKLDPKLEFEKYLARRKKEFSFDELRKRYIEGEDFEAIGVFLETTSGAAWKVCERIFGEDLRSMREEQITLNHGKAREKRLNRYLDRPLNFAAKRVAELCTSMMCKVDVVLKSKKDWLVRFVRVNGRLCVVFWTEDDSEGRFRFYMYRDQFDPMPSKCIFIGFRKDGSERIFVHDGETVWKRYFKKNTRRRKTCSTTAGAHGTQGRRSRDYDLWTCEGQAALLVLSALRPPPASD